MFLVKPNLPSIDKLRYVSGPPACLSPATGSMI